MTELKDLVGKMLLDGVDFDTESVAVWAGSDDYEDCQCMRIRLNGTIYAAIEDPNDGYRSSMKEIKVMGNAEIKNTFDPIEVVGIYRERKEYNSCDILEIVSTHDGKTLIEIGTEMTGDYYPIFVANFRAENMPTSGAA